ncbi:hypothetical protein F0562_000145 [Nyssa sinensis]|uniref:Uncharacterized protein n=1 Tax=Nyssa sinensis TaxID=561372 RepID=A0A5J5C4D6_9ASTE|nr:hypothetical protein F0562_000145 [Nyssa sinensis]
MKNMDYMDIDQVLDVPDTPDRIAAQKVNGRGLIEKQSGSSVAGHPGNTDFFDETNPNQLRGRNKLVIDNGHSRNLSIHPPRNLSISEKSEGRSNSTISALGNSSSSKSALLFRRMGADKTTKHENRHSIHSRHMEKGKALCTSQSSTHQKDNAVVDLTKQNGHARVFEKAFPSGALGNYQAEEIREGSISANAFSSLDGIENSSKIFSKFCKGKEKVDDTCKGGSGFDRGKGIDFFGDFQPKYGNSMPASINSITSPRVTGQKRLTIILIESKVKGLWFIPFSSEGPNAKTILSSSRNSTTNNEKSNGTNDASRDAFRCFEGLGGWRSTRNRTKKINPPSSDEGWHLSSRKDDPQLC